MRPVMFHCPKGMMLSRKMFVIYRSWATAWSAGSKWSTALFEWFFLPKVWNSNTVADNLEVCYTLKCNPHFYTNSLCHYVGCCYSSVHFWPSSALHKSCGSVSTFWLVGVYTVCERDEFCLIFRDCVSQLHASRRTKASKLRPLRNTCGILSTSRATTAGRGCDCALAEGGWIAAERW